MVKSDVTTDPFDLGHVCNLANQLLKNATFKGSFTEMRFVSSLNDYRHIVAIHEEGQEEFLRNVDYVKRRIEETVLTKKWLGITGPQTVGAPKGFCLWVQLPEEVFGDYSFRVKSLVCTDNEIRLKLQQLGRIEEEPSCNNETSFIDPSLSFDDNWKHIKEQVFSINYGYYFGKVTGKVTFENTKETIKFLVVLVVTLVTGLGHLLKMSLDYTLLFLKEFRELVKAFQPIISQLIHGITWIIMGVLHVFSQVVAPKAQYNDKKFLQAPVGRFNHLRALPPRKSSVVIEELYD